ncbi:hypothetical protein DFJ74DRAFT_175478 [Hyaloraphidium curvatum]|nr:hypothetical protein DFJ74DRAFT_175478 [Hyaloraphidium curvatum]
MKRTRDEAGPSAEGAPAPNGKHAAGEDDAATASDGEAPVAGNGHTAGPDRANGTDASGKHVPEEPGSVQANGAPAELPPRSRRHTVALEEEAKGIIQFRVVVNDGSRESMILLTGLKNIFQKQLPKMPKEYIARLVYDKNHVSMAVVKHPLKVVGGITYRPFTPRRFAEIVFCAIASSEQVKGYGARLMSQLKDHVKSALDIEHFLTYADNYAIGYFKKQGFTTDITLDRSVWVGYIKDYEGGTIMQCSMLPVKYLEAWELIQRQKQAIQEKIKSTTNSHTRYHGLDCFKKQRLKGPITPVNPQEIPGVAEAGWTEEMDKMPRRPPAQKRNALYPLMASLVADMQARAHGYATPHPTHPVEQGHPSAWPFLQPVQGVADYYEIIKDPMDLATLAQRVDDGYYDKEDEFVKDTKKIFNNCRHYNDASTSYVKNANKLEQYFTERLKLKKAELGLT